MKKLFFVILASIFVGFSLPSVAKAAEVGDEEIICPQPYGGGVVCGIKTHVPVETGLGDNLALVGALSLGVSGVLLFFSKKIKKSGI